MYCPFLGFALCPPASLAHGGKNGTPKKIHFRYWQVKMLLKAQDHALQIHGAAPGQQVVLAIYEVTSSTASTGVTGLEVEAVQEVNKMNRS
jgi:hypothetical protein